MKTTYNEILNNMKNCFFEKCGENVDLMSDLGARFQTVASELYSLYCYSDFILKQAFPQTASSKYLDYHASLRDIERKKASKAKGALTFYLSEPRESSVVVDKGCICSVEGSPYIQFATDRVAVIRAGELSVSVNATALEVGEDYNAAAGSISVMVNPPLYVSSVTNENEFIGGYDEECDDSLRNRILSSYSVPASGVSIQSMSDVVMKIEEVVDCKIQNAGNRKINVYVKTKDGRLDGTLIGKIRNALMITNISACMTSVALASPDEFDLHIEADVLSGSRILAEEKIRKAVSDYAKSLRIGENLNLNRVACIVSSADESIKYCSISSNRAAQSTVLCADSSYLKLTRLEVNCYE